MKRALICGLLLVAGCAKQTHDMDDQPRLDPQQASSIFADGRASQRPPAGTVTATGGSFADASGGSALEGGPLLTGIHQLRRGQARYQIYCAPCHGVLGDGNGIVAQRGFPHPPSYHSDRLRALSDEKMEQVIRDGYGLMFAYGDRIAPQDRAAIVAYIRALQRSQHTNAATLSAVEQRTLATSEHRP